MMSVLWGQDQVDTEDTLSEFVNRAMLFVDSQSQPNVFYLHDLQLDFLLEQNKNQLKVWTSNSFYSVGKPVTDAEKKTNVCFIENWLM